LQSNWTREQVQKPDQRFVSKMTHTFGKNIFTYEYRDRDPWDHGPSNTIYEDVMYGDIYYQNVKLDLDKGELYFYINWNDEEPDIVVELTTS